MTRNRALQVLVTGGSGFLGSNVVKGLLEQHPEWKVTVLDQIAPPADISDRIEQFLSADISSAEQVNNAFTDYTPDLVIHTAGIIPARADRYSTSEKQWERVKSINVGGTRNVLDATMAAGCSKFVYTSSCTAVVDDLNHDYYYMDEKVPIGLATLHYGKSKGLAEQYVLNPEHAAKGLKACALRPCTIIGEGDTAVISVLHDLIARGETSFIVGQGDNLYDFMYISNAVDAHILAAENLLTTQTAAGQAFFISNEEPVYFWDFLAFVWMQFKHVPNHRYYIPTNVAWFAGFLLEWITYLTGSATTLSRGSVADGVRSHFSNIGKAKRILGYQPKVGLSEGARRACEVYCRCLFDL